MPQLTTLPWNFAFSRVKGRYTKLLNQGLTWGWVVRVGGWMALVPQLTIRWSFASSRDKGRNSKTRGGGSGGGRG